PSCAPVPPFSLPTLPRLLPLLLLSPLYSGRPRDLYSFPTRRSSDLPRRRRGRQGDQGQAGGSASLAVERADSTGTPTRGCLLLGDRKSTRLNSSHVSISYAVFCLKKNNDY